jgi:hypothetical protein
VVPHKFANDLRTWLVASYFEGFERNADPAALAQHEQIRDALLMVNPARSKLKQLDLFQKITRSNLNSGALVELITIGFDLVNYAMFVTPNTVPGYARQVPRAAPADYVPGRQPLVHPVTAPTHPLGVLEDFSFATILEWSRRTAVPIDYPHDDGSTERAEVQHRRARTKPYVRPRVGGRRVRAHGAEIAPVTGAAE